MSSTSIACRTWLRNACAGALLAAGLATIAWGQALPPASAPHAEVGTLLSDGRSAAALAKAQQYLKQQPQDARMRFLEGLALADLGRSDEAIAEFTRLTRDYPGIPEPYNNLAVLYAARGDNDKARQALESAIRTNPSYAIAHENLGDLYARLASQAYSKALQLDGENRAVAPKLALIKQIFVAPGETVPAAVAAAPAVPPGTKVAAGAGRLAAAPDAAAGAAAAGAPAMAVAAAGQPSVSGPVAPPPPPRVDAVAAPAGVAIRKAPVTPSEPAPAAAAAPESAVEAAVRQWAADWSGQRIDAYLADYAPSFQPAGGKSRADWEQERRSRIVGRSDISVAIEDLHVTLPGGDRAQVAFTQRYASGAFRVTTRKHLELVRVDGRWLIEREST